MVNLKKIKFLHTADLHLDSPMIGLSQLPEKIYKRLLDSTFTALKVLVDKAIEEKVDFLIIAGDIYDGEDRSIRAQIRFRQEMERLAEYDIPVYLIHGNHDHLSGNWTSIDLPNNVLVFGEEVEVQTFKKQNVTVNLYGFSYSKRHVMERKIDDYVKKVGADFHIGILHGNDGGSSGHGNYAPFLVKDLLQKQFDYWALGHIHKSRLLSESPPILYPGNIQGRHHKEQGTKGCYIVTLSESDYQLEWVDTSDIEWDTLQIDVSKTESFQEVYHLCLSCLNQMKYEETKGKIVKLVLNGLHPFQGSERLLIGELLEILHENERDEDIFIWVSEIAINEATSFDKEGLKGEDGFYRELLETIENFNQFNETIESLYIHPIARKHLSIPSNEEQEEIIKEAERILVQLLYENG